MSDINDLRIASAKALDKTIVSSDDKVVWIKSAKERTHLFPDGLELWQPDQQGHEAQLVELLTRFHVDIEWSVGGMVTASRYDVHGKCLGQGKADNIGEAVMRAVAEVQDDNS